jgi:UDP-N-acetylglucosamine 4,6-dehydratase
MPKGERVNWRDMSVLVTGGTGSFGTKLVELMLTRYRPRRLVVFSRDELKQSQMMARFTDPCLRFFVGDVRDRERLERAMHAVDVVFHAAALKQIPSCEYNPFEAILTNVIGAKNVIDAAIDQRVKRVIALSTDKAVNPINLYGATKLCAEKLFVQGNSYGHSRGTAFSVVRYGNVIGSRGSVIPLFAAQRASGKVTVTDPAMTRFWIRLEQGVEFAVRCAEVMCGGEIFVPRIPRWHHGPGRRRRRRLRCGVHRYPPRREAARDPHLRGRESAGARVRGHVRRRAPLPLVGLHGLGAGQAPRPRLPVLQRH